MGDGSDKLRFVDSISESSEMYKHLACTAGTASLHPTFLVKVLLEICTPAHCIVVVIASPYHIVDSISSLIDIVSNKALFWVNVLE